MRESNADVEQSIDRQGEEVRDSTPDALSEMGSPVGSKSDAKEIQAESSTESLAGIELDRIAFAIIGCPCWSCAGGLGSIPLPVSGESIAAVEKDLKLRTGDMRDE